MIKHTPFNLWEKLGISAVIIGIVWAILWGVLSLLFPWPLSMHLDGFLLNPEGNPQKVEAVEFSFEGQWNPPLVQAICGEKTSYEYSGQLIAYRSGTHEKVSVMAGLKNYINKGWRDIICVSDSLPGTLVNLWGKEVGPLIVFQETSGIIATSLTSPSGEQLLLVCAKHKLTDEELTLACKYWMGLD